MTEPFVSDATVRLTTPSDDSTVTIAMAAAPDGPALATETFMVKAPVELRPDVGLAGFPTAVEPTNVHDYVVTGTLTKTYY